MHCLHCPSRYPKPSSTFYPPGMLRAPCQQRRSGSRRRRRIPPDVPVQPDLLGSEPCRTAWLSVSRVQVLWHSASVYTWTNSCCGCTVGCEGVFFFSLGFTSKFHFQIAKIGG